MKTCKSCLNTDKSENQEPCYSCVALENYVPKNNACDSCIFKGWVDKCQWCYGKKLYKGVQA